jgi:hypothetical protein
VAAVTPPPARASAVAAHTVELLEVDGTDAIAHREAGDFEGFLRFVDGAEATIGERGDAGELLDGDAEDLGELGENLGARGLVAVLPEGEVC